MNPRALKEAKKLKLYRQAGAAAWAAVDFPKPNIDRIVNWNAGENPDLLLNNAIHLVKMRRRNGDKRIDLLFLLSTWDMHNLPRRFQMFRRWQARYRRRNDPH